MYLLLIRYRIIIFLLGLLVEFTSLVYGFFRQLMEFSFVYRRHFLQLWVWDMFLVYTSFYQAFGWRATWRPYVEGSQQTRGICRTFLGPFITKWRWEQWKHAPVIRVPCGLVFFQRSVLISWNKHKTTLLWCIWLNLRDDKMGMLSHIYGTHMNPWGKLNWPYAITRLTAHFMCWLMFDLVICNYRQSMVIHDTECPYWDQGSLNNTKPNI